ncbi:MFS transporter [Nocardioides sp. Y6]|uniref:MFS transporter n=1 Tax=Nocardioides malaquae TaxID=2773426 RepID=A0ABR9RT29_9ACTN|nr:MFS transporter [Nocardioides malaquae]MBE7324743.1 MFS transporter [Nocardioides malaquae]
MTPPDDSRRVALLLGLLMGLGALGSSSVAVVLVLVGEDLGVSVGVAAWTISGYLLLYGVSTAVYGRVADVVGVRTPLLVGVGLMTIGSLASAAAPTFAVLMVGRVLQGVGAAAVPTLGVAVITGRYGDGVRALALGRLAAMTAAVSCLGPLIGGAVDAVAGWRGVMALPALGFLVIPFVWHTLGREGSGARIDPLGAVLLAAASGGLVLLVQSPSSGPGVALLGVTLLLVGTPLVALRVRRHPHGFLPRSVITNGRVVRSALAAASIPACWFALLVAVPTVLVEEGWTPWDVGLLLVPSAVVAFMVPGRAAPLLQRRGARWTLGLAAVIAAGALLVAALGSQVVSAPLLGLSVVVLGVAFGVGQPAMMAAVSSAVEPEVRGVALGVAMLVFMVGGSLGSAVVAGVSAVASVSTSLLVLALLPAAGLVLLRTGRRRVGRAGSRGHAVPEASSTTTAQS